MTQISKALPSLDSIKGLKRLWANLMNLLFFSLSDERLCPASAVALSIEKGGASIAYGARLFGKIKIKALRHDDISTDKIPSPQEISRLAISALNELSIPKREITMCIPHSWAVFKTAIFPVAVKDNLRNVITYELDRLTPFSSDEAYFDYTIINETGSDITASVMAVRTSVIRPYIEELKASDITVSAVIADLSAIAATVAYCNNHEDSLFISADNKTCICLSIHSGALTSASKTAIEEGLAISDTILGHIRTFTANLKKPSLAQAVTSLPLPYQSHFETIKIRSEIPVRPYEEILRTLHIPTEKRSASTAAGAVLCSLWHRTSKINLLSNGHREATKRPIFATILLLVCIMVMVAIYALTPLRREDRMINQITNLINSKKGELKKAEDLKKQIEGLKAEINTIDDFSSDSASTLNIIKELTNIIPPSTWLTRIRTTKTTVEIEGYAESTSGLLTRLEESRCFINVEFSSPSFKDMSFKADRFTIRMQREDVKAGAKNEKK